MANSKMQNLRGKRKNGNSAEQKNERNFGGYFLAFILGGILSCGIVLAYYHKSSSEVSPGTSPYFGRTLFEHSDYLDKAPEAGTQTVLQLLALSDDELEKVDILELNLAVACETEGVDNIDYNHYKKIIDDWTKQFLQWLPVVEQEFYKTPEKWENNINIARLGALVQWLDQAAGVAYVEEQKRLKEIKYTDLGHLLVHGLIDTRCGTCANMPVLHVAMGRRCNWPVALACVDNHYVCRYDDGKYIYNFETTDTGRGGFAMECDDGFIEEFNLSKRAISSGSDLRSLTARETLAVFIAARARYYRDTNQMDLADRDYSLARAMFPNYRKLHTMSFPTYLWRAKELFEPDEFGYPTSFISYINSEFPGKRTASRYIPPRHSVEDVMRMNEKLGEEWKRVRSGVPQNNPNPEVPNMMQPMAP